MNTMKYSEKQYENVAIFLDGGDITLSSDEHQLALEIQQDQKIVSSWLDDPTTIPANNVQHAPIWKKLTITTIAAAASLAIVASVAMHFIAQPQTPTTTTLANNETSYIIESISELDLIKQKQQEAELATLLLDQPSTSTDPVAEDIASNTEQWFQALNSNNQQGLAKPDNYSDRA